MKWLLFISIMFLNACSNLPENIKNAPSVDIQLHHVISNSNNFQNIPVRWGGTIIDVENQADVTKIQILFYPLNYYGRPQLNQSASGRFITVDKLFLDPAIYSKGTEITIAGTLQGTVEKKIGGKSVAVPIVAVDGRYIWPRYQRNYYRTYDYYPHNYGYRSRYSPYNFYRGGTRYYNCY